MEAEENLPRLSQADRAAVLAVETVRRVRGVLEHLDRETPARAIQQTAPPRVEVAEVQVHLARACLARPEAMEEWAKLVRSQDLL